MRTPAHALLTLLPVVTSALSCATTPAPPDPAPATTPATLVPSCAHGMPPVREFYEKYALASGVLAASLHTDIVRDVVRERGPALRACYEHGLARDPNLAGRFDVRWRIVPDGSVDDVELASHPTLRDACVVVCVMREVETWTFPPHGVEDGVLITYPFRF